MTTQVRDEHQHVEVEVRAALYQDQPNRWIARGLKYDVIGEGDSALGALHNLIRAIDAELDFAKADGREPFEGLSRTPEQFREWWRQRPSRRTMNTDDITTLAPFAPPPWMILAMETEARTAGVW